MVIIIRINWTVMVVALKVEDTDIQKKQFSLKKFQSLKC